MFDLPSDGPEGPGLADEYHYYQPQYSSVPAQSSTIGMSLARRRQVSPDATANYHCIPRWVCDSDFQPGAIEAFSETMVHC